MSSSEDETESLPVEEEVPVSSDDTQDIPVVQIAETDEHFQPQAVTPPEFVVTALDKQHGMVYLFSEQRSKWILASPICVMVLAVVGSGWFYANGNPTGALVYIPVLLMALATYDLFSQWFRWRYTWFLFTYNIESRKLHLRKARSVPTLLRFIFGDDEINAAEYKDLKVNTFKGGVIDGLFDLVSYKSDTAAQRTDEWLKDMQHLRNGKYFKKLMTWAGQQAH